MVFIAKFKTNGTTAIKHEVGAYLLKWKSYLPDRKMFFMQFKNGRKIAEVFLLKIRLTDDTVK